jgi:hypothetical protein
MKRIETQRIRVRFVASTAVLVAFAATPLSAHGQRNASPSVGASVGSGYGRGGASFRNRNTLAADAIVALHARPAPGGAVLIGLAAGWQGSIGGADDCLISPTGGCVPDFPSITSIAALIGWEGGRPRGATVRLVSGPGYYHGLGAHTLGLHGRVELATPAPFHVALVGFARGDLLPRLRGDSYALGAAGLGLRLQ